MNKNRLITNSKAAPRRRRLSRRPVRRRKYTFVADFCQHLLLVLVQQPKKNSIGVHLCLYHFFFHNYNQFFDFFHTKPCPPPIYYSKFSICVVFCLCLRKTPFYKFCRTMYYPKKKTKKKTPKNLKPTQDFCFVYSSVNNFICLLIL